MKNKDVILWEIQGKWWWDDGNAWHWGRLNAALCVQRYGKTHAVAMRKRFRCKSELVFKEESCIQRHQHDLQSFPFPGLCSVPFLCTNFNKSLVWTAALKAFFIFHCSLTLISQTMRSKLASFIRWRLTISRPNCNQHLERKGCSINYLHKTFMSLTSYWSVWFWI